MDNRSLLDLLEKYLSGELTPEEKLSFEAWFETHTQDETDPVTEEEKLSLFHRIRLDIRKKSRVVSIKKVWLPAAAACLLVTAGLFLIRMPWKKNGQYLANQSESDNTIKKIYNGENKEKQLTLPDGSIVRLAPKSELSYSTIYGQQTRTLYLKGKGYFNVAKDKDHTFIVYSLNISTTALGTAFAVTAWDSAGTTNVTVYSGKVVVRNTDHSPSSFADTYLGTGQAFHLNKASSTIQVGKDEEQSTELFATSHPVTGFEKTFDETPLSSVLDDLQTGYHISIKYRKKDVKDVSFSGTIAKSDSLSMVLKRIALLHNMSFKKSAANEFIMQKKTP